MHGDEPHPRPLPLNEFPRATNGANRARDRFRSIPIARFGVFSQIPGVSLISLQKGRAAAANVEGEAFSVIQFGDELDAAAPFVDTAAIMRQLDLVISCDTAAAHLAGALAVPVWLALDYAADWRWLLDRSDSPWYPTMRIFRQETLGDWNGVFARMATALRAAVDRGRRDRLPCKRAGDVDT